MIALKPTPYSNFSCPVCSQNHLPVTKTFFAGIRTIAYTTCPNCQTPLAQDYPIGHALHYQMAINTSTHTLYNSSAKWWSEPFLKGFLDQKNEEIKIEKKVFRATKKIVLLNTIDYLYGHSLLKLLNAQDHIQNSEVDLVIIAQKNFEWLIPQGCAEVWLVDLPFSKAKNWYTALDLFVQTELLRFEEVHLSLAFSHPRGVNIEHFTKVKPFNLQCYADEPPQITFVWRNDRLWHSNVWQEKLYLVVGYFKALHWLKKYFVWLQKRKFANTFTRIKKLMPTAQINVVGIQKSGGFAPFVNDQRVEKPNNATEQAWCEVYAKSHVVIGVHGSNMILPTALAAGFIEILPEERYGNITQDVLLRHEGNTALYLSRFADGHISPKQLALMARRMVKYFPHFYLNNAHEFVLHKNYEDVSKWKKMRSEYFAKNI